MIKRCKFKDITAESARPNITILLGARQVGKTTLLELVAKHLQQKGVQTRFFNLELPNDLLFFNRSDQEIFKDLSIKKNLVLFIDEFHYLKNASKLFKALYDLKYGIKIFASGSSSIEIHKHLIESLAGRRNIIPIYPLTWSEWKETGKGFNEFLIYGGLPGVTSLTAPTEKMNYLAQMVQAYLLKDVKGIVKEENIRAFNHLLFYLAEHQASILPVSNIANEISMSAPTIQRYLETMEQTFILHSVTSYSKKLANELKKSKKYFLYDLGIRNYFMKDFRQLQERPDAGAIAESFVLLELKAKQMPNVEIRFWATKQKNEVDFIWLENRIPIPIEVKVNAENDRIPNGLIKFLKSYPESPHAYVFNLHRTEDIEYCGRIVRFRKFTEIPEKLNN